MNGRNFDFYYNFVILKIGEIENMISLLNNYYSLELLLVSDFKHTEIFYCQPTVIQTYFNLFNLKKNNKTHLHNLRVIHCMHILKLQY